jgi:hypothetical protein
LAVIERWTHAFLGGYYDRSNDQTTLEEVMVLPFASKHVLGAQIGTKDDTSTRKFKDFTLSEFFGRKGGGEAWSKKSRMIHSHASQQLEISKIETGSVESQSSRLPRKLKHGANRKVPSSSNRGKVATKDSIASLRAAHSTDAHSEYTFLFLASLLLGAFFVSSIVESKLLER